VNHFLYLQHPERSGGIAIKVHNYSNEPIHEVSVGIDIWRGQEANTPPDESDGVGWDFLAPREEREIIFDAPQGGSFDAPQEISIVTELSFLDSSGRRFKRSSAQAAPQRILHDPQLVIQVIDGEVTVTAKRQEGRIKTIVGKVRPLTCADTAGWTNQQPR
jgi:hypothetical protein